MKTEIPSPRSTWPTWRKNKAAILRSLDHQDSDHSPPDVPDRCRDRDTARAPHIELGKTPNASIDDGYTRSVASIMSVLAMDTGRRQVYDEKARDTIAGWFQGATAPSE